MRKHYKAIVIGAGAGGLSCALKLLENKEDFLVISDTMGGRMCYSEKEELNFGAYFVMQTYHNAYKLIERKTLLNRLGACFHSSKGSYPLISLHTVIRIPELLRFLKIMNGFYAHYEIFKKRCLVMPQSAALQMDKYMYDIFHMSAAEFIKKNKIKKVADEYVSKFSYACTGIGMDKINALDYLNVSMGIMVPIHRFRFDADAMINKLGEHWLQDKVISVESDEGKHIITTENGDVFESEYIAYATPAIVTQKLLPQIGPIREACSLYAWHLNANLKKKYAPFSINLFPFDSEVVVTTKQDNGTQLIYTSRNDESLLNQVCDSYEIIGKKDWDHAMYVTGKAYVEQSQGNGIYIIGDHNGLGLEPTSITGIFAANQIIKNEKRWVKS